MQKEYATESIIFTEKLCFNFSNLRAKGSKRSKNVTILFSITSTGIILKPLAVLSSVFRITEYSSMTYITWTQNEKGELDNDAILKWVEESLIGRTNINAHRLLLSQHYDLFDKVFLKRAFRNYGIAHAILPTGSSCILSPFRKIIPIFKSAVINAGKNSAYAKRQQRMRGSDVLDWIVDGINMIIVDHPELLKNSFDALIKSK